MGRTLWLLAAGCWLLAAGCWLLVAGAALVGGIMNLPWIADLALFVLVEVLAPPAI